MKPKTRQTALGVAGIVVLQAVALSQGLNGPITIAAIGAIITLIAPEAAERLPIRWGKEAE
jgi:ABC-type glucose/galactose transport system permease subunit